jgi:hypothetical protein
MTKSKIRDFLSKISSYLYEKGGMHSFDYTIVGDIYVFVFISEDGETSVDLSQVPKKDLVKFIMENQNRKVSYNLYYELCELRPRMSRDD